MRNRAVDATWLHFQSFPLLCSGRKCYAEASTTSNSANLMSKLLTTAAMVDNPAGKVDKCPLNRDR